MKRQVIELLFSQFCESTLYYPMHIYMGATQSKRTQDSTDNIFTAILTQK